MTALFYSSPRARFFDSNANPLSSGSVEFYFAGTTTPKEIYTDNTTDNPAQNPQPLDIEGYVRDGGVWLGNGLYDVVLKDVNGVLIWTMPNVEGAPSGPTGNIGGTVFLGTIDDLVNLDTSLYAAAYVFGYYSHNDGGQGWFVFDETSSESPDGGAIIAPLGLPAQGRWNRVFEDDKLACTQWGACPSAPGSVNANLVAWTNYADGVGKRSRMWIPEGNYVVTPGSVVVNQDITVDAGVTFETNGPGAYFITINGTFNILGEAVLENPAGIGSALYDFKTQTYPVSNGEVSPSWYTTEALCMEWAGSTPIIIKTPLLVSLSAPSSPVHLRFRDAGSIDVRSNTLSIARVEISNPLAQVFTHPAGLPQTPISIQAGNTVYTRSFGGWQEFTESSLSGVIVQVNDNLVVNTSSNISGLGSIYSQGGYIQIPATFAVTFPSVVGPQTVRCVGDGDVTFSDNNYSRSRFVITNQADFNGFVNSAAKSGVVDAENLNTSLALDLTGVSPVTIKNLYLSGGVTGNGDIEFINCNIGGTFSVAAASIAARGCQIQSVLTALEVTLTNCQIQANVSSEKLVVKGCTIEENVELAPTASLGLWYFDITNNQFFGGYIKPNGTSLATKGYILNNDFQFPATQSPSTFLYIPIDDTNFNLTGEIYVKESSTPTEYPIAYNIRVADNTPAAETQNFPEPVVGTRLLQTVIKGHWRSPAQLGGAIIVNSETMLLPYIADDLWYNCCLATQGVLDTGVTSGELRVASKVTLRSTPGSGFEVDVECDTLQPTNLESYSYILDLYPQRNL